MAQRQAFQKVIKTAKSDSKVGVNIELIVVVSPIGIGVIQKGKQIGKLKSLHTQTVH